MNDSGTLTNEDLPVIFCDALRQKYGEGLSAIILYGSWLRGQRDTVIDLYVILDDYKSLNSITHALLNTLVAPNVYHMTLNRGKDNFAAKYATVSESAFKKTITRDFHTYFWARFAQPSVILYARNHLIESQLTTLFSIAAKRLVRETTPMLPQKFSSESLWKKAFELTYRCELRSESQNTPEIIASHLGGLPAALAEECALTPIDDRNWQSNTSYSRANCKILWFLRMFVGKCFSVARLLKALVTFDNPLDYLVWKIERHTGIKEIPTQLQRKYPLLFSWPLLWRIYKRGGFR